MTIKKKIKRQSEVEILRDLVRRQTLKLDDIVQRLSKAEAQIGLERQANVMLANRIKAASMALDGRP